MDWIKFLDISLMVGGFAFTIALLPSILGKNKPAWQTSLLTAIMLWVYVVGYAGNHLWLAFTAGIFSASSWTILFVQKIRQK